MVSFNGQTLAYLGDAVYELLVRDYLLNHGHTQVNTLHDAAVKYTSAEGQFEALSKIKPHLTNDESIIVKRGRNGKLTRKARNQSLKTYQEATGLEALFGHLYLEDNTERIRELFDYITV